VGGYKGGYYNNAGKYYLVTQRNAHVWVEAYLAKYGWMRLDPTPPITEIPWNRMTGRVLMQLRLTLDTFNYYWHKVIIDYDFTKQVEILTAIRARLTRPDIKLQVDMGPVKKHLVVLGLLIVVPVLFYTLIKSYKRREERIISRFLNKMASYGYEKEEYEGLEEFIKRIEREDVRGRAREFVEDFEQVFYRDREFTRETMQRMRSQINRI
jgi:protein-glutamine gamma-glutamyltransferase